MINIRRGDVKHAGNRNHESKMFNFEIENVFVEKITSLKDLKDELTAVCQHSKKSVGGHWSMERPRGVKTTLTFWRKEKKRVGRGESGRGTG